MLDMTICLIGYIIYFVGTFLYTKCLKTAALCTIALMTFFITTEFIEFVELFKILVIGSE